MASLTAIRNGLAGRLQTISGLRVYHAIPDKPELPAAVVEVASVDYDFSMGTGAVWQFQVSLLVSRWDASRGQDALDPYVSDTGAESVPAAIAGDRTLGGAAASTLVQSVPHGQYGHASAAGMSYLGCRFDVQVITSS